MERLEDAVETLISYFDLRLRKLEVIAARTFLERIINLLKSDATIVPEFRDKIGLVELSESIHEDTRNTALELREEIARRLTL